MKFRRLNKKEIDGINLFMSNVCDIDIVEGVYIVPYFDVPNRKQGVRVITVFNDSAEYLLKVTNNVSSFTIFDHDNLSTTILNYNGFFENTTGLSFFKNDSRNYNSCGSLEHKEKLSLQSLVSGTILFDRFGELEKKKFTTINIVSPFKEAVQLRNIDEVLPKDGPFQYSKK